MKQINDCSLFIYFFSVKSKHIEICEKQRKKQRKVFDSSKQRTLVDSKGDPIIVNPSSPIKSLANRSNQGKLNENMKNSNWREKHEDFIRTVRQARGIKIDDSQSNHKNMDHDSDASRRRIPAGYVECPTCDRRFSKAASERHIPWCKEQKARIPRTNNHVNNGTIKGNQVARKNNAKSRYAQQETQSTVKQRNALNDNLTDFSSNGVKNANNTTINTNSRTIKKPNVRYRSPIRKDGTTTSKVKARLKMEEEMGKKMPKTPVMKFKEKFPNHIRSTFDSITSKFLQDKENREEILKKPDNFSGPMIPKTVPGVRTRGLSPIRFDGKKLSLETEDLLRMKAQISEMYPVKSEGKLNLIDKLLSFDAGDGSANSSGIHSPSSVSKSKSQENIIKKKDDMINGASDLPRFCHQCGTKYLNMSKFCHECGARRLQSGGAFLTN